MLDYFNNKTDDVEKDVELLISNKKTMKFISVFNATRK